MTDLRAEIHAVLTTYVERWNAWEMAALRAMWDADEPEPIYVAEERDALIGWDALAAYWKVSEPRRSEHFIRFFDLRVRALAPTLAHAFYSLSWNFFMRDNPLYQHPIGGEVRATTLLRKKSDGWKLFHHIEAPLASLIQLRRAHEQNVDPELFAVLERKKLYQHNR
ncbi:MAG: hypothetical protein EXQ85_00395 [Alphaproteobacteria bacterium]|nr:hypothetical protein [Alphaproteobacteria bacterium]